MFTGVLNTKPVTRRGVEVIDGRRPDLEKMLARLRIHEIAAASIPLSDDASR